MATNTASFTMDSGLFTQLVTAASRRNGFVSGGSQLVVTVPVWTATIPDPAWQPTVADPNHAGQTIPNPTPQPQITNPETQIQFLQALIIYTIGGKIIEDDIHAQADAAKIAAVATAEAALEATRAANVAAALAAKNALIPTIVATVS